MIITLSIDSILYSMIIINKNIYKPNIYKLQKHAQLAIAQHIVFKLQNMQWN